MLLKSLIISGLFCPLGIYFAHKFNNLDLPDDRKKHSKPTAKSGGLSIWCTFFLLSFFSRDINVPLLISSFFLIITTILDDQLKIKNLYRLILQFFSIIPFLFGAGINSNPYLIIFVFISFVTLINLFNFFDGLNTILSMQLVGIILFYLIYINVLNIDYLSSSLNIFLGSVISFLLFNAFGKLFLGDIGSYFIALFIGFLCFHSIIINSFNIEKFIILITPLLPVLNDTISTLFIRIKKGEKFFSTPHRQHGYQLLNELGLFHWQVSLIYFLKLIACCFVSFFFINYGSIVNILGLIFLIGLDLFFLRKIRQISKIKLII